MQINKLKKLISANSLDSLDKLLDFLNKNWGILSEKELRDIAEYANANRQKNSAYYTDDFIVNEIINSLPSLKKDNLKILEPAVGTGNFVFPLIEKLSPKYKKITFVLNDIDPNSLKITKFFLSKKKIPKNVEIKITTFDFLDDLVFFDEKFDYVIGNPPFQRISNKKASQYGNTITNLAGQFLLKASLISKIVALVMPKNFLSTNDYSELRTLIKKKSIDTIIDFGEKGFKGVLIETISIILGAKNNGRVRVNSFINQEERVVPEDYITSTRYPYWLIYRNQYFDKIAQHMSFNVFSVFRDRQITNAKLSNNGEIKVYKSRNIRRDGKGLKEIPGYNKYISFENAKDLSVMKYYDNENVYLVPNMTYYPRMIKKSGKYIVNGSIAILELKKGETITEKQVHFFSTEKFRRFYMIARNRGTRSLNIDKLSIFWFGKYGG